jgi:hypothetical protein
MKKRKRTKESVANPYLVQAKANTDEQKVVFDAFANHLARFGGKSSDIIRALMAGFNECVEKNGTLPEFPLSVESKKRKR